VLLFPVDVLAVLVKPKNNFEETKITKRIKKFKNG